MGRVYNALVRAEKWKDGDRPIGRPDRNYAARGVPGDVGPGLSFNAPSAATAQSACENNLPQAEDVASPVAGRSFIAAESAEAGQSALVPRPVVLARRPVSESPASSAPVITFEEPSEVSNIRDLAVDPRLATLTHEDPLAVERYRALAVKLLNLADRRKLKTLLITSAEAGEGKTTVATGVAWSLAKYPERRVLLIDANPASPSVGRTFGIDAKRGWLNLVDRSCELKHALVRLDPNGLYVMTPGASAAPQSTYTLSSHLEDVIAELAPRFDLVVVDSPAILESPEVQRLAAVLDGAVIVARAGYTHHSKVTAARKLVPKERRLGVVLNESEADAEIAHRRRGKSSLAGRLFGRKR
jgi:capsular exopolysaccharide synthesis family protein